MYDDPDADDPDADDPDADDLDADGPESRDPGDRDRDPFVDAVHELVASIPPGRAMSYGDVAACLGSRAARRVGRIMATDSDGLPWWRVIRASGLPPAGLHARALPHYEAEGTPLAPAAAAADAPFRIARVARWLPD